MVKYFLMWILLEQLVQEIELLFPVTTLFCHGCAYAQIQERARSDHKMFKSHTFQAGQLLRLKPPKPE